MHAVNPVVAAIEPAAQLVHADMPVVAAIVPAAQTVHTEALAGANLPVVHAVATDKPATPHADPAGHAEQVEYPVAGA